MRAVKSRDTKPEVMLRKALHRSGLRYRICQKDLPGKPDLYFPKYKAAVFVHGCFWHIHNCSAFRLPATRAEFWRYKLQRNTARDKAVIDELRSRHIRVLIVWECALTGKQRLPESMPVILVRTWLASTGEYAEIDQDGLKILAAQPSSAM